MHNRKNLAFLCHHPSVPMSLKALRIHWFPFKENSSLFICSSWEKNWLAPIPCRQGVNKCSNTIIIMTRKLHVLPSSCRLPWLLLKSCFVSLVLQFFYIRFLRVYCLPSPYISLRISHCHWYNTTLLYTCYYFNLK